MSDEINQNPSNPEEQYELGCFYFYGFDGKDLVYDKARYWFERAAEQGHAKAQNELGNIYTYGMGVEQDEEKAAYWYKKAADQGLAEAQVSMGKCYQTAAGTKLDLTEAAWLFGQAAAQGNAAGQRELGLCYKGGLGVDYDLSFARLWLEMAAAQKDRRAVEALEKLEEQELSDLRAAAHGDAGAPSSEDFINVPRTPAMQYREGRRYAQKKDMAKAVYWYRVAAESGDYRAQTDLAECYEKGDGVEKDYKTALNWYLMAEHGAFSIKFRVGCFYLYGLGVEENHETAAEWFEKATSEEKYASPDARYMLGLMCECGDSVRQDLHKALELYKHIPKTAKDRIPKVEERLARESVMDVEEYARREREAKNAWDEIRASYGADRGYESAQYDYAMLLRRKSMYDEAYFWFKNAAEQGHAGAQYELGRCYEEGEGVRRDDERAAYWLEKALAQGKEEAGEALARVRERLRRAEEYRLAQEKEKAERERERARKEEEDRHKQEMALEEKEMRQAARERRLGNRDLNPVDPEAQFKLGQLCEDLGIDEDEDSELAAKWYTRAAQAGYAPAQLRLGWCYENAYGVARSNDKAAMWYDKAAKQGDRAAGDALGAILEKIGSGYDGKKYEQEREEKIWNARAHVKRDILGAVLFFIAAAAAAYMMFKLDAADSASQTPTFLFLGVFAVYAITLAVGLFQVFRGALRFWLIVAALPVLFIAYTYFYPPVPIGFAALCFLAALIRATLDKTRKFEKKVDRKALIREYRKTYNN